MTDNFYRGGELKSLGWNSSELDKLSPREVLDLALILTDDLDHLINSMEFFLDSCDSDKEAYDVVLNGIEHGVPTSEPMLQPVSRTWSSR